MHAGKQVGVDDVGCPRFNDHLLVGIRCPRFGCGNEGRADIGHVGSGSLRCQHGTAIGNRSGQEQGTIMPLADFLQKGKGRQRSGMTAGTRCDRNKAIGSLEVRWLLYQRDDD